MTVEKKRFGDEPETYTISRDTCQVIYQHVKFVEAVLGQTGFTPPAVDEKSSHLDIVVKEGAAYLQFMARRGSSYSIRNNTGQGAKLEFYDADGQSSDEAKKELNLEGDPPTLNVASDSWGHLRFSTNKFGSAPQTLTYKIELEDGTGGPVGDGPEMDIDDP